MRAASRPGGPRVLRVGLVHQGKVVDERIVGERDDVTIGPNESATLVVPTLSLPPGFRLFERVGEHYRLQLTEGMTGRIALATGPVELAALRTEACAVTLPGGLGSAYRFRLPEEARGKISIAGVTILFQLVAPVLPLGKSQLPANLKGGLGDVDWRTSVIAAFSFLFHFGAVGSIYADWMDPVVDDEVDTAQLLESVRQLPAPPPLEHPKEPQPTAASSAVARETSKPRAATGGGRVAVAGPAGGGRNNGDARAHQISSQLASLELHMLTGLNSNGSATSAVLDGNLPLGMLEKQAASSAGAATSGAPGLDIGGNGGPLRPGSITRSGIPYTPTSSASGAGSAIAVRPPSGSVAVPGPIITGGNVPNAGGQVSGMTPTFRRCYTTGLTREDPTMKGSVRLTARIGPNGEVLSVSATSSGKLSPAVVGCIRGRVASAQFSAPEGGGAVLVIPVTLIPQ